ncbi:MAG TPA: formyltetrahydrofolate deformylase [Saprospiraceae bacterium]|nr:formyltetrahydrofolate deformylase [Saprospiraceae bacterium]HPN71172.1 formyltetrahydrofolate deformylase [Saprospiraceae bacterium]
MSYLELETAIISMHCEDEKGIISAVTDFILTNNGNIVELDQHVDVDSNRFYMRIEWEIDGFGIERNKIGEYFETLVVKKYKDVHWNVNFNHQKPKMALFVSHYGHCLYDILGRVDTGEWNVDIACIISNHQEFEPLVSKFGIPFYYFEMKGNDKEAIEAEQIKLLLEHQVDLIVLARYMQILSPNFVDHFTNRIINIHHSSLPAFPGANPYKNAFMRGVKFMGATAHYVTSDLDEGPIIAQDVIPISHRHTLDDLKRRGRDIEKIVLANAVYAHLSRRVLTFGNKTVVFD